MPKNYQSAPNTINQDELGFIFQDLKQTNPRIWQAITSLRSFMQPMPFYAEIILPGTQTVANDILDHPCILRLPRDVYRVWEVTSVILQEVTVAAKTAPSSTDYIADILITRDRRAHFFSLFKSTSKKAFLNGGGEYQSIIEQGEIGTTELLDGDEFRVDVLQADTVVKDCWICMRGFANLKKLKRQQ